MQLYFDLESRTCCRSLDTGSSKNISDLLSELPCNKSTKFVLSTTLKQLSARAFVNGVLYPAHYNSIVISTAFISSLKDYRQLTSYPESVTRAHCSLNSRSRTILNYLRSKSGVAALACIQDVVNALDVEDLFAAIFQLLYRTELNISFDTCSMLGCLYNRFSKYHNIVKFSFQNDWNIFDTAVLACMLTQFPNIREYRGIIYPQSRVLTALQDCKKLELIHIYSKCEDLTSDHLSQVFFSGDAASTVKRKYANVQDVQKSFKKLKWFYMGTIHSGLYDFFNMFYYFYPNVEVCVHSNAHCMSYHPVSWFDCTLSHNLLKHPGMSSTQCCLCPSDLLTPSLMPLLRNWKKLKCISLSVGPVDKPISCAFAEAGKRLQVVLESSENITKLHVHYCSLLTEDEFLSLIGNPLQTAGGNISEFKLFTHGTRILYSRVELLLSCFPNATTLYVNGTTFGKPSKTRKFTKFPHLKNLTLAIPSDNNYVVTFVRQLLSEVSENLEAVAVCSRGDDLRQIFQYLSFPNLKRFMVQIMDLPAGNRGDYVALKKFLVHRFPKLQEIIIKTKTVFNLQEPSSPFEHPGADDKDLTKDCVLMSLLKDCQHAVGASVRRMTLKDLEEDCF